VHSSHVGTRQVMLYSSVLPVTEIGIERHRQSANLRCGSYSKATNTYSSAKFNLLWRFRQNPPILPV